MDSHGLRPVLHYQSKSRIEDKVRTGWEEARRRGAWAPSAGPRAGEPAYSPGEVLNSLSRGLPASQAQILLDCGEDNICVPDLQLEVFG